MHSFVKAKGDLLLLRHVAVTVFGFEGGEGKLLQHVPACIVTLCTYVSCDHPLQRHVPRIFFRTVISCCSGCLSVKRWSGMSSRSCSNASAHCKAKHMK